MVWYLTIFIYYKRYVFRPLYDPKKAYIQLFCNPNEFLYINYNFYVTTLNLICRWHTHHRLPVRLRPTSHILLNFVLMRSHVDATTYVPDQNNTCRDQPCTNKAHFGSPLFHYIDISCLKSLWVIFYILVIDKTHT